MKKSARFLVISSILTAAALVAAFISATAAQVANYDLATLSSRAALILALGIVVYVVPGLARNLKLEYLRGPRAVGLPTAGLIFGVLVLIVATAALTTGNNLLYMVFAMLIATLVVSWGASRVSLSDVGVALRFPDHIFAGEPAELEVTVTNRKRLLPAFSLTVALADARPVQQPAAPANDNLRDLAHFEVVQGKSEGRAGIQRCFPGRGIIAVRGFRISSRFPFGFVERRRVVDANGEIVIYPKLKPLDAFYHLLPISQGQIESLARGSGSDLYAIRQYLRTDHPRHVDWKATAKTARLMVRDFTRDDDRHVTVALDAETPSSAAGDYSERFEMAITLAASLVTHFLDEGADVRLLAGKENIGFGHDLQHRYAMLRQLARLSPGEASKPSSDRQDQIEWALIERLPELVSDDQFKILITPAPRGSIPASVWRSAHVVYFDDLNA
jgi:uncharacterized protein (DUF58 family)